VLIIGNWIVAGRAAQQMLAGRMSNAGEMTAESLPFFLETGQNLILRLANDPDFDRPANQVGDLLSKEIREVPYFSQLIFVDPNGGLIASDPVDAIDSPVLSQDEIEGINLASFVPIQIVPTGPEKGGEAALISFIAGVRDQDGDFLGALIGRNDLAKNPFAKPLLASIGSLAEIDGKGLLVDENGVILYHPDPNRVMTQYTGFRGTETRFYEDNSSEGVREFIYYRPTSGKSWSVIITVPSQYAQQQAINIAIPLLGMITLLAVAAIFIFRFGLIAITFSLKNLALEADRMSQGHLDTPLLSYGEDEVGQLRRAFEKMRASLKSRLDELNRLLVVSQGIASALEIEDSLKPVLEAALVTGASSARVYLLPSIVPSVENDNSPTNCYGAGSLEDEYAYLDEQVVALAEQQEVVKLTNITRPRIFSFAENAVRPQAIMAVALRHENQFYGTLWIAYDSPHQFTDEESRYIITLAGQAALAAANARLYLTSEFGRQRLETILTSTPDPVLVTDQNDNLILTNPAAQKVFKLQDEGIIGKNIADVVSQEELLVLLSSVDSHQEPRELSFQNGNTYLATASTIQSEGSRIGRVYVLRDVTSFKQLDALKSEFVSTVSHDLRSPLALIQGYTSMLKMVGELNDQQSSYLEKISSETEKISHLVKNLLDLGRIEAGVGLQLEKKPIQDVVHHVVSALQVQADQKRVQLDLEITHTSSKNVEADQALIEQAIYNLVENAIKYTDSGGEVKIIIRSEDENVIYAVQDNGIGISPADQQNLFEKFYRISSKGNQEERGSGLGLAIVKSIAERHGGDVHVESQLGVGSTFYLVIPMKQAKSESPPY
jgi:PAS domain S-box-containing protein